MPIDNRKNGKIQSSPRNKSNKAENLLKTTTNKMYMCTMCSVRSPNHDDVQIHAQECHTNLNTTGITITSNTQQIQEILNSMVSTQGASQDPPGIIGSLIALKCEDIEEVFNEINNGYY